MTTFRLTRNRRGRRLLRLSLGAFLVAASLLLTGCFTAPPQIVELSPPAGSTQLDADAPVQVIFDQPVDRQSVAAHFSVRNDTTGGGLTGCDLTAAFQAGPGAPCYVTWLTDRTGFVLRHPGALFAPNTRYTFTLGAGVASANGNVNSLDHVWPLTSAAAPVLTSASPGDGATAPRDAPFVLSFSRAMSASAVAAAISLTPGGTGLRVVANPRDLGQFEVIPETPLAAGPYTLTVSRQATDAHGQPIPAPVTLHFTAGPIAASSHLLVLAGSAAGEASEVMLAQPAAPAAGLPIPAEVLSEVPACTDAGGCGQVPPGQPTATIDSASLSPGARWLALVQTDATGASTAPLLRIVDLTSGADQLDLTGAEWPVWSPVGPTLAFVAGGSSIELYDPTTGQLSALHSGNPPSGPPVWTSDGTTLAIPVAAAAGSPAHVDLATPAVSARYQLPGITGDVAGLAAAPQGEEMAIEVSSAGGPPATWIADPSSGAPPTELGAHLRPVGFRDNATLVVSDNSGPGAARLEALAIGTRIASPIAITLGAPLPGSAAVAPGGRQIAYVTMSASGASQAVVANADGTGALPVPLGVSGAEALSVLFEA